MIAKASRGWKVGGLIRYLMGPGRFNEHIEQRVVASWDGDPAAHQPPARTRDGYGDFDVDELVDELLAPAFAGGVSMTRPAVAAGEKAPQGPVWHCSLRNHESDRELSDEEWAAVVADVMDATGIAPHGDEGGCRWVAVRHAADHVHIAAVLVRQDTLARVYPYRDYPKVREVARAAEVRLGLTPTAAADRTAVGPPTRAEVEKAGRRELEETSREWLRRAVKLAAVQAQDPEAFFTALEGLRVTVAARRSPAGEVVGYKVAAARDLNAQGEPVWFSGSTLSPDLSLPNLRARWASAEPVVAIPKDPGEVGVVGRSEVSAAVEGAVSAMEHATATLAAGEDSHAGGEAAGIAHAVEDMIAAVTAVTAPFMSTLIPAGGPGDVYARAARESGVGQPKRWGPVAEDLRAAAWRLVAVRTLAGRGGGGAGALVLALASLIAEIAAYHEARQRLAQASAARAAVTVVHDRRPPGHPAQVTGSGSPRAGARPEQTRGAARDRRPVVSQPIFRPMGTGTIPNRGRRR